MDRSLRPLLLALGVLLLPIAQAIAVDGEFVVDGGIALPAASRIRSNASLLFAGDPEKWESPLDFGEFRVEAPRLKVTVYWNNLTHLGGSEEDALQLALTPPDTSSILLHDAHVVLNGAPGTGYVGLDAAPESSSTVLLAAEPGKLLSAQTSEIGGAQTVKQSLPDHYYYSRVVSEPHHRISSPGNLDFSGNGTIKIYGLPLRFTAREGTSDLTTGQQKPYEGAELPGPLSSRASTLTWVILEGDALSFFSTSGQPWTLVGEEVRLDWEGEATFRASTGTLATEGARYANAAQRLVRLEGRFDGSASLLEGEGLLQSRLAVRGDLSDTNLETSGAAPLLSPSKGPGLLLVGVVVGAVLGSAGGVMLWRRRERRSPPALVPESPAVLTPAHAAEYYAGLAEQCIQFEDHARALHWISLAREASPTSSNVMTTLAYVLGELGQFDDALAAYAEASAMDPSDGEADLNAARLAAQAGRPVEEFEALVLRALDRTPEFVFDVEEDPEFRALAQRPAFREGLLRAWRRWGDEESAAPREASER